METTAKAIAIAGLNASGKTQLVERMRRQMASDSVRYVAFCDTYGTATDRSYYLQQRWNQHDIDEETPTVSQALERSLRLSGSDTPERRRLMDELSQLMGMTTLMDKYVIALSSGELRKLQLVKTLMAQPTTLILDNPFIGLDAEARQMLCDQLLHLRRQGVTLYLVLSRPAEIPPFIDDIIWTTPEEQFRQLPPPAASAAPTLLPQERNGQEPAGAETAPGSIVELHDVSIRYGDRTILNRLSWTVVQGERWALSGRNGSGKSTLLSLITADNPQGYACDITLFGRRRGSGESIWDIKRHIGYVSPEMHRSYVRALPAVDIVASGLKDTVGLYVRPTAAEREQCMEWMRTFCIDHLAHRLFTTLSSGEQRMVLVARAFVKWPSLLILDEPMHGLDMQRQQLVKNVIDAYFQRPGRTLIMVTHYPEELPRCITHHLELGHNSVH